ncbi:MAG: amidase [Longimicrobiales bacterium]
MSEDALEGAEAGGITRRSFVAASALVAAGTLSCSVEPTESRAAGGTGSRVASFELDELTIDSSQEGLASGRWTSRRLVELYLGRIDAIDRSGPMLRSVIETNVDALDIADQLDEERRGGRVRGPLHGIPILVKDNIATADRMQTTAGSYALENLRPPSDAPVAARLREAGAILLGKTNLSEWANFRSTRSSSGWSARGGQCRNPYVLDRNPCGSSSGSGAAAAANLCAVAIGTETDGSIVCPSTANGLVGIKPTIGLVSRTRIVPISHTQDTAGPMARTVRDAAIVLGALAAEDAEDPATAASRGEAQTDYTQFLDANGLSGARIGIARDFFGFHSGVDALMEDAIRVMSERGAVMVDPVRFENRDDLDDAEFTVLLYEFKADIALYLAGIDAGMTTAGGARVPRTLADLIAFNQQNAERELVWFGQEIFEQAEEKGPLSDAAYRTALAACGRIARDEAIDRAMREHRLDAILAPTGGPAWTTDLVNGDHFSGGSSTLAAVAGYPNVTVPAGMVQGLPIGVSLFGRAWSEPVLLRLAYAFEQATQHREAPRFLPSLGA